jgi:hypothetical protein
LFFVTCLSFAILFPDTCRLHTAMFVWGSPYLAVFDVSVIATGQSH